MFTPKYLNNQKFYLSGKTAADAFEAERQLLLMDQQLSGSASGAAIARAISRLESIATVRIDGLSTNTHELLIVDSIFFDNDLDYFYHSLSNGNFCIKSATMEAFHYLETLRWIQHVVKPGFQFTPKFILDLHSRCLYNQDSDITGITFRKRDFDAGRNNSASNFTPPTANEVPLFMEDLCAFINTPRFSPLVQTGYMHFQFEAIKPFRRGMDRTGRALCHALLRARNVTSGSIPAIALLPALNVNKHAESLLPYNRTAITPDEGLPAAINKWINFCAESTSAAWNIKDDYLDIFSKLEARWLETTGKVSEGSATQGIMKLLFGYPILTVEAACKLTGKQFNAVNDAMKRLETAGVITQIDNNGCTKSRLFEAKDVTGVLQKFEAALIAAPPVQRDFA